MFVPLARSRSGYIWQGYRNGASENDDHRTAKLRIGNLLLARGWSVRYEMDIEIDPSWTVIADIYAAHPDKTQTICIELDGAAHNTTSRKHGKDKSRDRALAEKGIITVRFEVEDINGRWYTHDDGSKHFFQVTDEELLRVIDARTR